MQHVHSFCKTGIVQWPLGQGAVVSKNIIFGVQRTISFDYFEGTLFTVDCDSPLVLQLIGHVLCVVAVILDFDGHIHS